MLLVINEKTHDLNISGQHEIRRAVETLGYDWKDSRVFVLDFPERGRYLQKSAGYEQLGAGG